MKSRQKLNNWPTEFIWGQYNIKKLLIQFSTESYIFQASLYSNLKIKIHSVWRFLQREMLSPIEQAGKRAYNSYYGEGNKFIRKFLSKCFQKEFILDT